MTHSRIYTNQYNTTSIISEFQKTHNTRYDYSKVLYVSILTPVSIICKIHGEFKQKPTHHKRGNGCPMCALEGRRAAITRSADSVIAQCLAVHGERYEYTNAIYHNMHTPFEIICKDHGSFFQKPGDHIHHKTGCPTCAKLSMSSNSNTFIKQAELIHNNKYDYSLCDYINNHTQCVIICPDHGEFSQLPSNHLQQHGCPQCASVKRSEYQYASRMTPTEFISRASIIHNNMYDYTSCHYTTCDDSVTIICPTHGPFSQRATNHLHQSQGCPECVIYGCYTEHFFNNNEELALVPGMVYLVKFTHKSTTELFYKIGITKRSIKLRFQHNPEYDIVPIYSKSSTLYNAFKTEQQLLTKWQHAAYVPSVVIGGDSECFKFTQCEIDSVIRDIDNSNHNI